jgi:hypothetical protein
MNLKLFFMPKDKDPQFTKKGNYEYIIILDIFCSMQNPILKLGGFYANICLERNWSR